MSNLITESVTDIHHWNASLFSFKTTRRNSFRFENGEFVMLGIEVAGKPLLRAYSIVSANYQENLEFLSIKVPDGALTSRLQNLKIGDPIYLSTKPTGTLTKERIFPGKNLYLLSSGTGIAPFIALIKDPEIYHNFAKIILAHSVRYQSELAYQDEILHALPNNEFFGDLVKEKLLYYPTVTREKFTTSARLTTLLESEKIASDNGLAPLQVANDRFMLCGNPGLLKELCAILEAKGFKPTVKNDTGHYVIERAFVDKG